MQYRIMVESLLNSYLENNVIMQAALLSFHVVCFQKNNFDSLLITAPGVSNVYNRKITTLYPRSSDPFHGSNLLYKMGHYFLDTS